MALEVRAARPYPALGVLGAPVVADHAAPAVDAGRLAVDGHGTAEGGRRVRAERLRTRHGRAVHPAAREVVESRRASLEREVPGRRELVAGRAAGGPAGRQRAVPDPDVPAVARGRRELLGPDREL